MSFSYLLSSFRLKIFTKKNLAALKEFVRHKSLNKICQYKFYLIKDLFCGLPLDGIFSFLKKKYLLRLLFAENILS